MNCLYLPESHTNYKTSTNLIPRTSMVVCVKIQIIMSNKNGFRKTLEWFLWWKVDKDDLEIQVKNYNELKFYKSYRGIAGLLLLGKAILSIALIPTVSILQTIGVSDFTDVILNLLILLILYPILSFLVFKGKKIALIIVMVVSTISLINSFINAKGGYFWMWLIVMKYFYGAYIVEKNRKLTTTQNTESKANTKTINISNTPNLKKHIYRKSSKTLILLGTSLLVIILSGCFYWYEYRPIKIKQECSWTKKHIDAIPERPARTEIELKADGLIRDCIEKTNPQLADLSNLEVLLFLESHKMILCEENRKIIDEYNKTKLYEPAKDWSEKATKQEYDFCIKSHGLAY